jgi:hypothetical protein
MKATRHSDAKDVENTAIANAESRKHQRLLSVTSIALALNFLPFPGLPPAIDAKMPENWIPSNRLSLLLHVAEGDVRFAGVLVIVAEIDHIVAAKIRATLAAQGFGMHR